MPVGLISISENGTVQIDENHYCLSMKAKGSATASVMHPASVSGYSKELRYVDVAYNSPDAPIFAIRLLERSPVVVAGVSATTRVGDLWTFRVCVLGTPPQSFAFDYYIYDRPDWITAPGNGIALRDADLKPIFNSNNPVMVVKGQQSGDYGAGRTYAFACTGIINYFHEIIPNTPSGFLTTEVVRFIGAYCTSSGVQRSDEIVWGDILGGDSPPRFNPEPGLGGWGGGGLNPALDYTDTVFSVIDSTNQ